MVAEIRLAGLSLRPDLAFHLDARRPPENPWYD
jgi:hypothetical protein